MKLFNKIQHKLTNKKNPNQPQNGMSSKPGRIPPQNQQRPPMPNGPRPNGAMPNGPKAKKHGFFHSLFHKGKKNQNRPPVPPRPNMVPNGNMPPRNGQPMGPNGNAPQGNHPVNPNSNMPHGNPNGMPQGNRPVGPNNQQPQGPRPQGPQQQPVNGPAFNNNNNANVNANVGPVAEIRNMTHNQAPVQMSRKQFSHQFPLIASMELFDGHPSALKDRIGHLPEGQNLVQKVSSRDNEISGWPVIIVTEAQLQQAGFTANKSSRQASLGDFQNSLLNNHIFNMTLHGDKLRGQVVILPTKLTLNTLSFMPRFQHINFYWGLFSDSISDSNLQPYSVRLGDSTNLHQLQQIQKNGDQLTIFQTKRNGRPIAEIVDKQQLEASERKRKAQIEHERAMKRKARERARTSEAAAQAAQAKAASLARKRSAAANTDKQSQELAELRKSMQSDGVGNSSDAFSKLMGGDMPAGTNISNKNASTKKQTPQEYTKELRNAIAYDNYDDSLHVKVSAKGINQIVDEKHPLFFRITNDDPKNHLEQVSNSVKRNANDELASMHVKDGKLIINNWNRRINNGLNIIRKNLNLHDKTTQLGAQYAKLRKTRDAKIKNINSYIKKQVKDISNRYDTDRSDYMDAARKHAAVQYDHDNRGNLDKSRSDLKSKRYHQIMGQYQAKVQALHARRHSIAKDEINRLARKVLRDVSSSMQQLSDQEMTRFSKYSAEINAKVNNAYNAEKERVRNVRFNNNHDDTINRLRQRLSDNEKRAKSLTDNNKSYTQTLLNKQKSKYLDRINNLRDELSDSRAAVKSSDSHHSNQIAENQRSYENRIKELRDEVRSVKQDAKNSNIQNESISKKLLMGITAVLGVAIFIVGIGCYALGTNHGANNANNRTRVVRVPTSSSSNGSSGSDRTIVVNPGHSSSSKEVVKVPTHSSHSQSK